jgi:predicted negative regulator of RcsB-dependent stress response
MVDKINAKFTEDDDLARAKAWWNTNGRSLSLGVIIGLVVVVGYNLWNSSENNRAEQASQLFSEINGAYSAANTDRKAAVNRARKQLFDDYGDTPYAANAALILAARAVQLNDLVTAEQRLRWLQDKTTDGPLQHISRIRLIAVLLAQDKITDAQAILDQTDVTATAFAGRYLELKGYIFAQQKRWDDAREAYQNSLESALGAHREIITLKRDDLPVTSESVTN